MEPEKPQQHLPGVEDPMKGYVTLANLSRLLDMSDRNVQYLAKDGIIPPPVSGQYHFVNSLHGYIKRLRAEAAGRAKSAERETLEIRQLTARVIIEEVEAAKVSGNVIDTETVLKEWENLLVTYKTRSRLIPRKTGQEIADSAMAAFLDFLKENMSAEDLDHLSHKVAEEIPVDLLHKTEGIIVKEIDEALNELSKYDPAQIKLSQEVPTE